MITNFPFGIQATPIVGGGIDMFSGGTTPNVFFVDGDNGSDGYDGTSPSTAFKTISAAIAANSLDNTVIYVKALDMASGATDPSSYTEAITIPATKAKLRIIGVSNNRTQGGLPQIKGSATSTTSPILTIQAPGCTIQGLGFNGVGVTGGGILLDDNGTTKTAFGTSILGCHFKNCKGSTATNAATGGAIQIASTGGAWQLQIKENRFYDNVADIVLLGTSQAVPQDWSIVDNEFSDSAAATDCNIYLAAGSGVTGLDIYGNYFGAFPALSGGSHGTYAVLTSCTGTMSNNFFGCSGKTFGAAANVLVPTTVLMAGNYQEGGLIART